MQENKRSYISDSDSDEYSDYEINFIGYGKLCSSSESYSGNECTLAKTCSNCLNPGSIEELLKQEHKPTDANFLYAIKCIQLIENGHERKAKENICLSFLSRHLIPENLLYSGKKVIQKMGKGSCVIETTNKRWTVLKGDRIKITFVQIAVFDPNNQSSCKCRGNKKCVECRKKRMRSKKIKKIREERKSKDKQQSQKRINRRTRKACGCGKTEGCENCCTYSSGAFGGGGFWVFSLFVIVIGILIAAVFNAFSSGKNSDSYGKNERDRGHRGQSVYVEEVEENSVVMSNRPA